MGGVALLVAALGTGVAGATAKLDKASVPANTDQDLVLEMSVEELVGYNQKIILTVPAGFTALSCTQPTGFKCSKSTASNPTRALITWENTNPAPVEFGLTPTVRFPFRIHTITATGDYPFPVDQYYSNGERTNWNGARGSANPAPELKVTSTGTPAVTSPPTTAASGGSTSETTSPSLTPSYDFSTATTVVFDDATTPTTAVDTTATTNPTTDTTIKFVPTKTTSSGDGGKGIEGVERVFLLGIALLAVGAAAFGSWRQRA